LVWRSPGREALTQAGILLAGTKQIVIATGIANIYARDPVAMAAGQKTLAEAYPGRFVLGLGVSHVPLVEQLRGHRYEKPASTMRAYLDAMDQAPYQAVPPSAKPTLQGIRNGLLRTGRSAPQEIDRAQE
jgi:alkanesulfonate monooxygenase SsuD/methylene tetrahydromethanopterin reductase-like flavin-dependent oxidoreductase (luciferase family)